MHSVLRNLSETSLNTTTAIHIPPMYFSCCEAKLLLGNCLDGRVLTQIPITKWSCAFAIRYSCNLWTGICKTNIFGEVSTVRHTSFGSGP